MRYKDRKPLSNEEIVKGYEKYGETAVDALRDARSGGYNYQYGRGFAHGAICAGIGCLIGGVVDLLLNKQDHDKRLRAISSRMNISRKIKLIQEERERAQSETNDTREDNNE